MNQQLQLERTRFVELRRRLLELHPDLDDQTLADTLEGATDFKEALAALIRSALEDECLAKALKERLDQMRGRLNRLEARASSKRQVAVENVAWIVARWTIWKRVLDECWSELVRVATMKAVEIIETLAGRPAIEWSERALLPFGRQVPLSESRSGVTVTAQSFRDHPCRLGND